MESLKVLVNRVLKRDYCRIQAYVGNLEEGLRKWGFALNWMMSGSRNYSMTDYLNAFFSRRRKE